MACAIRLQVVSIWPRELGERARSNVLVMDLSHPVNRLVVTVRKRNPTRRQNALIINLSVDQMAIMIKASQGMPRKAANEKRRDGWHRHRHRQNRTEQDMRVARPLRQLSQLRQAWWMAISSLLQLDEICIIK